MKEFLNYFKRQWYPRLPAQRTTNALEGWHRRVNGIIPPTPNLFHFIFKLHKEAKHADSRIQFTLFYKLKKIDELSTSYLMGSMQSTSAS